MIRLVLITALFFCFGNGHSKSSTPVLKEDKTIREEGRIYFEQGELFFKEQNYSSAIESYLRADKLMPKNTVICQKLALSHAALGQADEAVVFIQKYFIKEYRPAFLEHEGFKAVITSPTFQDIVERHTPKATVWSFIYLYVALIGFYVAVIINFNRKIDGIARFLISAFIFIHSFFIFHICFDLTNYSYTYPHSQYMSTWASLLYGPFLFLYFRRITKRKPFRPIDLLHFLPTVFLILYLLPIYMLSAEEKLSIMLNQELYGRTGEYGHYTPVIVSLKFASLAIYGLLIRGIYLKGTKLKELSPKNLIWQRNVYFIHVAYIISYGIYGLLIYYQISSGFLYHLQLITMSLMVVYVGYSANVQPQVFSGLYSFDNQLFFKYRKSGLTQSLSQELKNDLIRLFEEDKVYKDNNINLDVLAAKLHTTRHNASQVINEHFELSFNELINKYRINEAIEILNADVNKNMNIIDIAYDVGYNNRATFNKAFKKNTRLTPKQFQQNIGHARIKNIEKGNHFLM